MPVIVNGSGWRLCAYLVGSRGWQSRYWAAACRETLFHRALCAHPEEADLDAVLDYGLDFCGDDAHARGGDHGEGGVAPERAPVHRRAEPVVFLLVARVQAHIEEEHAARHEPRRHPRDELGLLAGRHVEYRIEGRDEVERLRWELDARHVASQELDPGHALARHLDAARRDVDRSDRVKLAREVSGRLCTRTASEVESRPARRDERKHRVDPGATGAVALLFLPALVTVEDRVVSVGHHPLRIDAHASNSMTQRTPGARANARRLRGHIHRS